MAKGLTAASMDKDFQEKRRLTRQVGKPNHPVDGLSIGATSFINGISSGLTGLATAPMEGQLVREQVDFSRVSVRVCWDCQQKLLLVFWI